MQTSETEEEEVEERIWVDIVVVRRVSGEMEDGKCRFWVTKDNGDL